MSAGNSDSSHNGQPSTFGRRGFLKRAPMLVAGTQAGAVLASMLGEGYAATQDGTGKGVISGSVVETTAGRIRGMNVNGIRIFKGVPYGASTGGANRFMPPRKPVAWTGVRDTLSLGPSSPQLPGFKTPEIQMMQNLASNPSSEDCLVLNLWTPGTDNARRPVMFWLHGGGFQFGSGGQPFFDGANLARRGDVVTVTINHRLGCLGHLHLGDLGGPAFAKSGNVGMLDAVAALEWVRDNIDRFGGDPNNVMIFGESGGGSKVSTLLGMPAAKGLFHRAAIESGPALTAAPREAATRTASAFLNLLGLDRTKLDRLQERSVEELIEAQSMVRGGFSPVHDGDVIPENMFDPIATPISADVPLLIGSNKDEGTFLLQSDAELFSFDEAGLRARVKKSAGGSDEAAERILGIYRKTHPDAKPTDYWVQIYTDRSMRMRSITLAERKAAQKKAPVYMYFFAWNTVGFGGKYKALHMAEIPFVFDNIWAAEAMTHGLPEAKALAAKISSAWIAFARTGNPGTKGLPDWPTYSADRRSTMILDNDPRVENDPSRELRLFWLGEEKRQSAGSGG
jgi:para-nitrobenzyl esterase